MPSEEEFVEAALVVMHDMKRVRAIRAKEMTFMRCQGATLKQIGRRFHVSQQMASAIVLSTERKERRSE